MYCFLICIVGYYYLNDTSIEIECAFECGLKQELLRKTISPLNYFHVAHLDTIYSINKIIRSNKIRITGLHVRVHQDYYFFYEEINWWEQRNVDMGLLAKSVMYEKRSTKFKNK